MGTSSRSFRRILVGGLSVPSSYTIHSTCQFSAIVRLFHVVPSSLCRDMPFGTEMTSTPACRHHFLARRFAAVAPSPSTHKKNQKQPRPQTKDTTNRSWSPIHVPRMLVCSSL